MITFEKEIVYYLQGSGVPKEQAEDVVQDVFIKMLESDFVIPAQKMRAWMYRGSIRRYIDKYRRDKHYMEILRRDFFTKENQLIVEGADYDFLMEEVEKLPTQDKIMLDLYYFQGFSTGEIAEVLHYSKSKVKVQLMRSRNKLRQVLEKKGYHHGNF